MVHDLPDDDGPSTVADAAAVVPRSAAARRERKVRLVDLARRLSVNPRTIYKWLDRGAPASLDEAAMREWCRMNGVSRLRPPLVVDVPRGSTDAPGTTTAPDAAAAAGQSSDAPVPEGGWSPAQRKADADAKLSDERRRKVQLEIAELERRLVGRDDLVSIAGALALVFVHELTDLPAAAIRALDQLPVDWRKPVRRAIEDGIERLRGNLESTLRAKLVATLNGPAVSRAD
jgi:hypothetical protein